MVGATSIHAHRRIFRHLQTPGAHECNAITARAPRANAAKIRNTVRHSEEATNLHQEVLHSPVAEHAECWVAQRHDEPMMTQRRRPVIHPPTPETKRYHHWLLSGETPSPTAMPGGTVSGCRHIRTHARAIFTRTWSQALGASFVEGPSGGRSSARSLPR